LFCPPCRKTRSVLPEALPPICRWDWGDILCIVERLLIQSPYAIARSIGESLSSLVHLKSWIGKAGVVVLELARTAGLLEQAAPNPAVRSTSASLSLAVCFSSWAQFTHCFSRTLYPKRFPISSSHTILTG
jgi:hypothetical protein